MGRTRTASTASVIPMRFLLPLTLALAATLAVAGATARATAVRVTQGDATAVFEAFGNGGWSILRHSHVVLQGAPADGLNSGLTTIRPIRAFFDGNHYCALDWHVIVIAIFDGGDASYTAQEFEALRSQTSIAMTLDGQPLPTVRTASKRFLRDLTFLGITTGYYFQQGRVMSPDELSVGAHKLAIEETDPAGGFHDKITFSVDPPGTGACLRAYWAFLADRCRVRASGLSVRGLRRDRDVRARLVRRLTGAGRPRGLDHRVPLVDATSLLEGGLWVDRIRIVSGDRALCFDHHLDRGEEPVEVDHRGRTGLPSSRDGDVRAADPELMRDLCRQAIHGGKVSGGDRLVEGVAQLRTGPRVRVPDRPEQRVPGGAGGDEVLVVGRSRLDGRARSAAPARRDHGDQQGDEGTPDPMLVHGNPLLWFSPG